VGYPRDLFFFKEESELSVAWTINNSERPVTPPPAVPVH